MAKTGAPSTVCLGAHRPGDADYVWPDGKKGGYFVYYSMWNRRERYDRMYYSYADEPFYKAYTAAIAL